jgi:hypothetical protein
MTLSFTPGNSARSPSRPIPWSSRVWGRLLVKSPAEPSISEPKSLDFNDLYTASRSAAAIVPASAIPVSARQHRGDQRRPQPCGRGVDLDQLGERSRKVGTDIGDRRCYSCRLPNQRVTDLPRFGEIGPDLGRSWFRGSEGQPVAWALRPRPSDRPLCRRLMGRFSSGRCRRRAAAPACRRAAAARRIRSACASPAGAPGRPWVARPVGPPRSGRRRRNRRRVGAR